MSSNTLVFIFYHDKAFDGGQAASDKDVWKIKAKHVVKTKMPQWKTLQAIPNYEQKLERLKNFLKVVDETTHSKIKKTKPLGERAYAKK